MKYAVVVDGAIVRHGSLSELFPGTSFPVAGPNEDFLLENNLVKISRTLEHDPAVNKLMPCDPYIVDDSVVSVTLKKFTKTELDKNAKAMAKFNGLRG